MTPETIAPAERVPIEMTLGTQEIQMVVSDINEAHDELSERGTGVTEIDNLPWGDFVYYADPDGNKWSVQALPPWSSQSAPGTE